MSALEHAFCIYLLANMFVAALRLELAHREDRR